MCDELLAELTPLTGSCGVNGALVCFIGSNAHWAGVLARALGRLDDAQIWLEQALATHQRLGALVWEAEARLELAALAPVGDHAEAADAELRRDGELWLVRHRDSSAHFRDLKGLTDLAALLARPGTPIHVLDLAGAGHQDRHAETLLDATARAAYRRRLADLDEDLDVAREDHDIGRLEQVEEEALLCWPSSARPPASPGAPGRSDPAPQSERGRPSRLGCGKPSAGSRWCYPSSVRTLTAPCRPAPNAATCRSSG